MKPIRVSNTILSEFSFCPQFALYRMNGYVKRAGSLALMYGTVVHKVIERVINLKWLEQPDRLNDRIVNTVNHEVRQVVKGGCSDKVYNDLHAATFAIQALLMQYFNHWFSEGRVSEQGTYLAVEHKFEVWYDVGDQRFIIDGILDGVMLREDGLWIIDHKTAAKVSESLLYLRAMVAFQNRLYLYMHRKRNQWGYPFKGMLYDVIRKPALQQRKGKGKNRIGAESDDEFNHRVQNDIYCDPDHYFKRVPAVFNSDDLFHFGKMLDDKLLAYAAWIKGEAPTYSNDSGYSCAGGLMPCDYLEACAEPGPISKNPLYHYERSERRCPYIPKPMSQRLSAHFSL